jgi:alpha-galactosidase
MAEANQSEVVASHISREIGLDAANPAAKWQTTQPIRFSADWQGRNPDPALETEVRVLWSPGMLYLRFACSYRQLFVFQDSDPDGRRDHLWDRDVAEAFLQPEPSPERYYKEFEIAPNGMWVDLDISPSGLADLKSGLSRSVHIDEEKRIWTAEMAIPLRTITTRFDPSSAWRANFYRIEGAKEPRRYMAWRPTHTQQPNFHVPEAFGALRFDAD